MFWLIVFSALVIIFLLAVAAAVITKSPGPRLVAALVLVIALVFTAFNSFTTVGARSVGIQTGFGKYMQTLDNGFHIKAPYSSVEEFSTQVQYLDLNGEGDAVAVTFKGGGGGNVNATVRWRIDAKQAENLWSKYRTFEAVRDQLVTSSAKDSFRVVVANYTPNDARSGENIRPITEAVVADLSKNLANDGIVIDSVSISSLGLDANSQASLDRIVQANNDIERATAEQQRAQIDAETARIRQETGALAPEANIRYCLELVNSWDVAKNGNLPATFNCALTDPANITPVLPVQ